MSRMPSFLRQRTASRFSWFRFAGFIARRIVCYADTGDTVKQGEIFGLIRFGSRVDLYLPPELKPLVSVGQRVKGGESIIGSDHEKAKVKN